MRMTMKTKIREMLSWGSHPIRELEPSRPQTPRNDRYTGDPEPTTLNRFRAQASLTQRKVGELLGITGNTVSKWDRYEDKIPVLCKAAIEWHKLMRHYVYELRSTWLKDPEERLNLVEGEPSVWTSDNLRMASPVEKEAVLYGLEYGLFYTEQERRVGAGHFGRSMAQENVNAHGDPGPPAH
jgi:transcriptional regulator with XRE-family HTH domain